MEKPTSTDRARAIVEQRRSSAAGSHGKYRKDRRNVKRRAIADSRAAG
jgi:hypothetical protein